MSEVEYNNLIFVISRRLQELNVLEQLLFMCRGKLANYSDANIQDVLSLFKKLEEQNYLGTDRLEVIKDLLKGVEEWPLLEKVKKFESKRKEYLSLLEQIIRALDQLNDLERLITMCRGKMPEANEGNIHDVRSLFKVLENHSCLGINRMGIVKEILIEIEKEDLLKEVEEFEKRICEDEEFERRKAHAVAVVSSVKDASERMIGAVRVHCTFRKIGGALLVVGTGLILRRCSSLEEFVEAFREATLPAATALQAISEGSVCFTVQAETTSALEALWQRYRDGTLRKDLQEFLVTEEIRQLADEEEVAVSVYIDEQELRNALVDLKNAEQEVSEGPEGLEEQQPRYLDHERLAFVQSYLEKAEDARSMTTETSDSGVPGTNGASSELGMEEANDSTSQLFLKDLNKAVTAELTYRLQNDPIALERFHQSFGLDPRKLYPERLRIINELFPDTPVRLLKDVFEALQLYDLAELLEKAKPRALRPALPLREIGRLPNARNRPTTFYSKVSVLIIDNSTGVSDDTAEKIESFFKALNTRNEVTTVTAKPSLEKSEALNNMKRSMQVKENSFSRDTVLMRKRGSHFQRGLNNKDVPGMEKEAEEREKWTKEQKPKIEQEIKKKEEELEKENEKFQMAVSTVMDEWIHSEGIKASTLFAVFEIGSCPFLSVYRDVYNMIGDHLTQKLALIPRDTKLVINTIAEWKQIGEISETLQVESHEGEIFMTTMLELLSKRWQTLDLISIMQELQRTLPLKRIPQYALVEGRCWERSPVTIRDNLSCLPRLKKTDQNVRLIGP